MTLRCQACGQYVRGLSPETVDKAYALYRRGYSVKRIAEVTYLSSGYSSPGSMDDALRRMFHRRGFSMRSRSEAVAASNRRRARERVVAA